MGLLKFLQTRQTLLHIWWLIHWKKLKENNYITKSSNFIGQLLFFHIWLHVHLRLKFIVTNQVDRMPRGIQWPLNHLRSHKNNYIFIYFGMPLKIDDINIFFIFIFFQIDINCKYKLHMQLQTTLWSFTWLPIVFTKCHGGQLDLKSQKWLIWTQVANAWVGMDRIPCSDTFLFSWVSVVSSSSTRTSKKFATIIPLLKFFFQHLSSICPILP